MPYDLFWHGDPEAARAYRESDRLSLRRADALAWQQGRYVYDAMLCAAPPFITFHKTHKPQPYDEMPYSERTEREERQRKQRAQLENGRLAALDLVRWVDGFNAKHER